MLRRIDNRTTITHWLRLIVVCASAIGCAEQAFAQQVPWDLSPYRVRVWIAYPNNPELNGRSKHLERAIRQRIQLTCGPAWKVDIAQAPEAVAKVCVEEIPAISPDALTAADAEIVDEFDKVFLVRLSVAGSLSAEVREYDTPTQIWGDIEQTRIQHESLFGERVADLLLSAFAPVGRIGRVRDDKVAVRMRAGMLTGGDLTNPVLPQVGDTLQVVIRKNDRLGALMPNGISIAKWTLLSVQGQRAGNVDCEIVTGLKAPFRSRGSRRVERYGMLIRPRFDATTITFQTRGKPDQKLTGYDVFAKLPTEKKTTWVGRSDWRGQVTIARDEHPFKVFYVRNGNRLLARLPFMPGHAKTLTADMTDDSQRLAAEGFVMGLQEHIVDLVARREILMARVRRRIEEGDLAAAEKLVDEVRLLESRDQIDQRMRNEQQLFTTEDRSVQDKIDRLFRQTKEHLYKYLDPVKIDELRDELAAAKRGEGRPKQPPKPPVEPEVTEDDEDESTDKPAEE